MYGYDFNAGSDGDDAFDDMFEPVVWHPAAERTEVSALLQQPCERVVGMVADGNRPESWLPAPKWDSGSLDPANLLRRAVYEHNPELYVHPRRPKRRRSKGTKFSLGEILHKLQSNPEDPGIGVGNAKQRKAGFEEYCRMYSEVTGLTRQNVRAGLRGSWAQVSMTGRMAWFAASLIRHKMYAGIRGSRRRLQPPPVESVMNPSPEPAPESPFPEFLDVHGMLCSWNTRAGLDGAHLQRAKAENLAGDNLVAFLIQSAVYVAVWQGFARFVQRLANAWGFPTWACCMEVSLNSEEYGRVHLHAFWGQALSNTGWNTTACQIRVQPERLRWDGNLPDLKVMRVKGWSNQPEKTSGGLYYCWAKKNGSMFRTGNCKPFQD